MGWQKKYDHMKPYKRVLCIDDSNCKLLNVGYTNLVIKETETTYLIQFKSGAANWYDKTRFTDVPKPKAKKQKLLTKQLF